MPYTVEQIEMAIVKARVSIINLENTYEKLEELREALCDNVMTFKHEREEFLIVRRQRRILLNQDRLRFDIIDYQYCLAIFRSDVNPLHNQTVINKRKLKKLLRIVGIGYKPMMVSF